MEIDQLLRLQNLFSGERQLLLEIIESQAERIKELELQLARQAQHQKPSVQEPILLSKPAPPATPPPVVLSASNVAASSPARVLVDDEQLVSLSQLSQRLTPRYRIQNSCSKRVNVEMSR